MSTFTTVRIADPLGQHLIEVANYHSLSYVLNCTPGGIGVLEMTLPVSFDASLLKRDGRIGVWRAIAGRPPYLDNGAIFLISVMRFTAQAIYVRAYHATSLMQRRIIAYAAGSTYCTKAAAPADNQIKAFWKENAGASIVGADRDGADTQADLSAYVTTQADISLGASVAKSAARRNLHTVAQELAEASTTAGTYLTFEIIAPSESTLELRTSTGQRGVDHGSTSSQPVIVSEGRGNLENAQLTIDYQDEATFIIAAGQGEGTARLVSTASDSARMGVSPFGRIEDFRDMSNVGDLTSLQDDADAALRNARPVITFEGDLIETPATTRGIHFDLGDIVVAEDPRTRTRYDVRIDVIQETIGDGGHTSKVALRSVT